MEQETIIKADITQVKDGIEYNGNISFDSHDFKYEIMFGIPITELNEAVKRSPNTIMDKMYLEITDSKGKIVSLDNQVKSLFMGIIGPLAIEFYNNPQTRDSNEGLLGRIARREEGISFGMNTEYKWPKIPELEKFLEGYRKE